MYTAPTCLTNDTRPRRRALAWTIRRNNFLVVHCAEADDGNVLKERCLMDKGNKHAIEPV